MDGYLLAAAYRVRPTRPCDGIGRAVDGFVSRLRCTYRRRCMRRRMANGSSSSPNC
jgi:hypothetical protein